MEGEVPTHVPVGNGWQLHERPCGILQCGKVWGETKSISRMPCGGRETRLRLFGAVAGPFFFGKEILFAGCFRAVRGRFSRSEEEARPERYVRAEWVWHGRARKRIHGSKVSERMREKEKKKDREADADTLAMRIRRQKRRNRWLDREMPGSRYSLVEIRTLPDLADVRVQGKISAGISVSYGLVRTRRTDPCRGKGRRSKRQREDVRAGRIRAQRFSFFFIGGNSETKMDLGKISQKLPKQHREISTNEYFCAAEERQRNRKAEGSPVRGTALCTALRKRFRQAKALVYVV